MDYSKHLFRASSFGSLMTSKQGITKDEEKKIEQLIEKRESFKQLTAAQQDKYDKLSLKETLTPTEKEQLSKLIEKTNEKVGLSKSEETTLNNLIYRRDNTILSKGAKTYLRKLRREIKFNRRPKLVSKYLTKGIDLEEEAITFLSIWHDKIFTNNKERVSDEYFTGEVDILEGYDTKCSFILDTLPDPIEKLDSIYEYQNRIYMRLHNADKWTTSYILLDATDKFINQQIYSASFKYKNEEMPMSDKLEILNTYIYTYDNFIRLCKLNDCLPDLIEYKRQLEEEDIVDSELEKACSIFMGFVEIPDHERIVEKTVYRDLEIEQQMVDIAILARQELQRLEEESEKLKQKQ